MIAVALLGGCGFGYATYRPKTPEKRRTITHSVSQYRVGNTTYQTSRKLATPMVETSGGGDHGFSIGTAVGRWSGANGSAGRKSGTGTELTFQYARSDGSRGWGIRSGLGARLMDDETRSGWWVPVVGSLMVGGENYNLHLDAGAFFGRLRLDDSVSDRVFGGTVRAGADLVVPFEAIEFLVGATIHYMVSTRVEHLGEPVGFDDVGLLFHVLLGF